MQLIAKTKEFAKEYLWTAFHMLQPTRSRNMKYTVLLSWIAALSVYLILSAVPQPLDPDKPHFTICIFKLITDIPCPGCGTTRGLKFLFHGMPYESLMMNPMAILTATFMAVTTVWIIYDLATGKSSYLNLYDWKPGKAVMTIFVILTLANWAWNIYKGV